MLAYEMHKEACHRALEEVGDTLRPNFCIAYHRAMQKLVEEEMIREGKSLNEIDEFWGNEM